MGNMKREQVPVKQYSVYGNGMAICTFLTIISQLPQLVDMGLSSNISRIVWISFFAIVLLTQKGRIELPTMGLVFMGGYIFFILTASAVMGRSYYATSLFSSIVLSFFIFVIGLGIGKEITEKDLLRCAKTYVIASTILALVLYFTIYDTYDISSAVYGYGSKNSAGVILFTALLIAFVYGWREKARLNNLINLAIILLMLFMVLIMKVRAMIVCIPVVAIVAVIKAPFKRSIRLPIILLCIGVLILLQIDAVYDLLINDILFASRGEDFANASSGRIEQWSAFLDNMQGRELLGDGKTGQESLILTAFLQCGIPMGIAIVWYALWPLRKVLHWGVQRKDSHVFLLLLVALVYFIDAIFEQLAPFGPGARCFYLWLLFGIMVSKNRLDQNRSFSKA